MTGKPRILVVEDEEFGRDLLTQLLSEEYDVISAGDGAAGVALAAREHPDLILMDLTLPVLDGWEATRRIKDRQELAHIPIIAVTGHDTPDEKQRARACGCVDFVLKPIDEDHLLKRMAHHLGRTTAA